MDTLQSLSVIEGKSWQAILLDEQAAPLLQQFFERNPEYFQLCNGRPPQKEQALEEIRSEPPSEMTYTKKYCLGVMNKSGELVGMTIVFSDFIATSVWLISEFMLDKSLHGTGLAHQFYQHLEDWMQRNGAEWLRLGVVKNNFKAERFWIKTGFIEVRERSNVPSGIQVNTLRVMVKPLNNGLLSDYLAKVARDRPEA